MSSVRRTDITLAVVGVAVIASDQLTKHLITAYFGGPVQKPAIQILGSILDLEYTQNRGVAFSLFDGQGIKYVFILAAVGLVAYLYWRTRATATALLTVTYGLILGGAIGNLLDRFTLHYVVDFIHFKIPNVFDWPVFNVADSAISVGVVLLAILLWRTPLPTSSATPEDSKASGEDTPVAQPRVRRKIAGSR